MKTTSITLAVILFLGIFSLIGLGVTKGVERARRVSKRVTARRFGTPETKDKMARERRSFRARERLRQDRLQMLIRKAQKR